MKGMKGMNVKRLLFFLSLGLASALAPRPSMAQTYQTVRGWCESGAQPVVTSGLISATKVQASYPSCTVTVFAHGGGITTIYSTDTGGAQGNPFSAQTNGQWTFYATAGRYDIQLSGGGIPSPITYSDVFVNLSGGGGAGTPGGISGDVQCNTASAFGACGARDSSGTFTVSDALVAAAAFTAQAAATVQGALTVNSSASVAGLLTALSDTQLCGPNPSYDLRCYGGYASTSTPPSTTGTITAGTATLTLAAPASFANGQGIVVHKAGANPTITTPGQPTVTPINLGGGATTYTYKAIAEERNGALTAAGTAGTTTTGRATLGANSIALTNCTRVSGIATYTASATHNIAVGAQINISGFGSSLCTGVKTVATTPTGTTFTTNDGTGAGDENISASGFATVFACNKLDPPSGSYSGNNTLRYWWYRGNALVGVAEGIDPFWIDCGLPAPTAPSYIPTTPPGATQPGYLATIVTAGGGTTSLTLASNATTSVTGITVLHDNSSAQLACVQATLNNQSGGGTCYDPNPNGSFNFWTFNATTDFSTLTTNNNSTRIHLAGNVNLNQPWVLISGMDIEGEARINGSFQYVSSTKIAGNGYPLLYAPPLSSLHLSRLQLSASLSQQIGLLTDQNTNTGGSVGVISDDVGYFGSNGNNIPVVIKSGFDFYFNRGVMTNNGAAFGPMPSFLETVNSPAVVGGLTNLMPYRTRIDGAEIDHRGILFDCSPEIAQNYFSHKHEFRNILYESLNTPFLRLNCPGTGSGSQFTDISLSNIEVADSGAIGTPIVDAQNLSRPFAYFQSVLGLSGSEPVFISGSGGAMQAVNMGGQGNLGNVSSFHSFTGGALANGTIGVTSNGRFYSLLNGLPPAPTLAVVAGGSVPIGTENYKLSCVDIEGFETTLGPSASVVTSSGNQTVNINAPSLPLGCTSWLAYRDIGGGAYFRSQATAGPVSPSATAVDTFSFTHGDSPQITNNGAVLIADSSRISAPLFQLLDNSGSGFTVSHSTATALTANRTARFPDATGTLTMRDLAQTWTQNQTLSNGTELRFLSNNGTNYAGFKGGASVANLVWLFPTTDSTGTQCLSSNGSLQLSWSACSGGTGTPGGANTHVQFNNAGSFAGSTNLTWTSPALSLGSAGGATGQVKYIGTTSGIVTTQSQDVAGTWTFKLPNSAGTAGQPMLTDGSGVASWGTLTVPGGGTGATTLTANQLLTGNGASAVSSVAGSTTGTNPILKLQPSSAANTALTLDTAASPTGDVLDINLNGVKTSWFDSSAILHTPQATYSGTGAFTLSGTEGTCPSPVSGSDILCLGDSGSHSAQISNNGVTFKPVVQWTNTAPNAHGVVIANPTFPQQSTTIAGTSNLPLVGQGASTDPVFAVLTVPGGGSGSVSSTAHGVLLGEGTSPYGVTAVGSTGVPLVGQTGADPIFAALSLSGAGVSGILPIANGGTGSGTLAGASIATVTGVITPGNCASFSAATVITDAGAPCGGGGGSPPLSSITAGTASHTINSTIFPQTWNWALTGSTTAFKFGENTAATGSSNILLQATTASGSTALPFQTDNNGNGWQLASAGRWQRLGTGSLAIPGTAHGVVVSQGAAADTTTIATGTAGQVLISNGAGADSSFQDPIISLAYVNLWTAQDVTTTRTSAAVRNPVFSQTGTLQLTWASITGSPSGCTLQIRGVDSQGNVLNNGSTLGVSPANGTSSQTFTAAASLQTAAQISAVFACSTTYPTTGTLTLDFTPIPNVNVTNTVSNNVTQLAGTAVDTNSGSKSGGTLRVVIATDQPALTNKLLVTPDSVALPANQSVNVNQVAGTTADTNSGTKSAGTLRVVLATDQPALTNKLLVTPDSVALPANQSVNVSQMNGATTSMNNGTTDAGTQRVTLSSDSTGQVIPAPTTASSDAVSACNILSAASTNSTSCKGSAGNFYGYEIYNTTTTIYYLRLYNSASAPTCSSATGFIRTIPIPPAGAAGQAGGAISNQIFPVNFGTGIGYCITGGSSSTDNTNAATGVFGEVRYK